MEVLVSHPGYTATSVMEVLVTPHAGYTATSVMEVLVTPHAGCTATSVMEVLVTPHPGCTATYILNAVKKRKEVCICCEQRRFSRPSPPVPTPDHEVGYKFTAFQCTAVARKILDGGNKMFFRDIILSDNCR
jgi:hypothetical protein